MAQDKLNDLIKVSTESEPVETKEITQVQITKETRKKLQIFKASMQFKNYDETIKFLLDDFLKKEELLEE